MSNLINPLPFTLINGTTADATQVMADLLQVVNDVNSGIDEYVSNVVNDSTINSPTINEPTINGPVTLGGTINGGSLSSTTTGVTAAPSTSNTGLATNAYVENEIASALSGFHPSLGNLTGPVTSVGLATSLNTSPEAIPNGWTATTQTYQDNSTKIATTAYVDRAALFAGIGTYTINPATTAFSALADAYAWSYPNGSNTSGLVWAQSTPGRGQFSSLDISLVSATGVISTGVVTMTVSPGTPYNGLSINYYASYSLPTTAGGEVTVSTPLAVINSNDLSNVAFQFTINPTLMAYGASHSYRFGAGGFMVFFVDQDGGSTFGGTAGDNMIALNGDTLWAAITWS